MKKNKKILNKILVTVVGVYVIFTLVNQQKTLNQYTLNSMKLSKQIEEEKENNEELNKKKDDVNSLEFIEEKAREMLDMYYPNERIYVNNGM